MDKARIAGHGTDATAVLNRQSVDRAFNQLNLMFPQLALHRLLETAAVRLDARAAHRASLAHIEHSTMDGRGIGGAGDDSAERIDFAHEMALADPTDRRIARHAPDVATPEGCQRHARAAPRRGGSGFYSGVTGTNDENIDHRGALAVRAGEIKSRLFHVKLFSQAEPSEQGVEQRFHS